MPGSRASTPSATRFTIHAELPAAALPAIDWEAIRNLFPVAVTIAILGAIESLLSATVADGVIDDPATTPTPSSSRRAPPTC